MLTNLEGARSNPVANFAREKKRGENYANLEKRKKKKGTPANDQRRASALKIFRKRLHLKLLSVNKRLDSKDV